MATKNVMRLAAAEPHLVNQTLELMNEDGYRLLEVIELNGDLLMFFEGEEPVPAPNFPSKMAVPKRSSSHGRPSIPFTP